MEIVTERLIVRGTPAQIYAVLMECQTDSFTSGEQITFHHLHRGTVVQPDSPRIDVYCICRPFRFSITAVICPDNRTQVAVRAEQEKWTEVYKIWSNIVDYMDTFGYLVGDGNMASTKTLKTENKNLSDEQQLLLIDSLSESERDRFERYRKIEEAIKAGRTQRLSCELEGVDTSTYRRWREKFAYLYQ